MVVMAFLALAHACFWAWGLSLAVQTGAVGWSGVLLLGGWLAAIALWIGFVGNLSRSGWLTGPGVHSHTWLWVPTPTVMLSLCGFVLLPDLREAWLAALAALPAAAMPALHSLRILALGTVIKAWNGQFPRRIGFAVGLPDMAFGLWSLFIAVSGGFANARIEATWNLLGAAIMLLMIPMVFTVLRPPRLDDPRKGPARAILAFPMVLAPAGLASLYVILHALSLAVLLGPDRLTIGGN
jgi:hypothetical protein